MALDGEFEPPIDGFINPNASLEERIKRLEVSVAGMLSIIRLSTEAHKKITNIVEQLNNKVNLLEKVIKSNERRSLLTKITQMNNGNYR